MSNFLTVGGNTQRNAAARKAIAVWNGAIVALVDKLKHVYPDDTERARFAQKVVSDLENPEYRLYSIAYVYRIDFANPGGRHTVIGRRA